ncbi:MAG: tyrosine-type recombinase/integrase [Acidobacteria bacterium]|nr:tyrosine-type recombinase/integrase [Acidobacteriota bacterium]
MPKDKFTAKTILKLEALGGKQTDFWDTESDNLVLRVTPSGSRSWCVIYRIGRRQRRYTLGKHPAVSLADARDRTRKALNDVSEGRDPAQQKQADRDAISFEALAADFMEKYARKRKKSAGEDDRIIMTDLNPHIGKCRAKDVSRGQIRRILEDIAARAPIQANRTLACIRKIFNWAISESDVYGIEVNPCYRLPAPGEEKERDRVLGEDEIRAMWAACEKEESLVAEQLKLRLLTAQRGGEVSRMQWTEVDFESAWWTIPAEKAKNGLSHRVPLSAPALKILQAVKATNAASTSERRRNSSWVFPAIRGNGCLENIRKTAVSIFEEAKIEDVVPHDLRRTAASFMTSMGIPRLTVSKILNHVEGGVTKIYDRYSYDQEKRDALDAWGRRLMIIVSGFRKVAAGAAD